MKTIGRILLSAFTLAIAFNHVHAQTAPPDGVVALAADVAGLPQVAPLDVPVAGSTCWWVLPGGITVAMPFLPPGSYGGIWQIAPQQFLVDQTGGSAGVNPRRFGLPANSPAASVVAVEVQSLVDQITQIQATAANQQGRHSAWRRACMVLTMAAAPRTRTRPPVSTPIPPTAFGWKWWASPMDLPI